MIPYLNTFAYYLGQKCGRERKIAMGQRLWKLTILEVVPSLRSLVSPPLNHNSGQLDPTNGPCTSVKLAQDTVQKLLEQCRQRRLSLHDVLCASLYLTMVKAMWEKQTFLPQAPERVWRAVVLMVVCVVMALLSGIIESKALRYFCSIYAVLSGIGGVNMIAAETRGLTILMCTSAMLRGWDDKIGTAFTPVRLALDAGGDLWETACWHRDKAHGVLAPQKDFECFVDRVQWLRTTWRGKGSEDPTTVDQPPFQALACIPLERSQHRLITLLSPETVLTCVETGQDAQEIKSKMASPEETVFCSLFSVLNAGHTLVYQEVEVEDGVTAANAGSTANEQGLTLYLVGGRHGGPCKTATQDLLESAVALLMDGCHSL